MEAGEIIRRWQQGQTKSQISVSLGYDRKTVRKYISALHKMGIDRKDVITEQEKIYSLLDSIVSHKQSRQEKQDVFTAYRDEIKTLFAENQLKVKSVYEVLLHKHELKENSSSLSSFRRFVHRERLMPERKQTTCRIEVPAAHQIQIDYAKVGCLFDAQENRNRTVYAFIGTLSYSRHKYVEFVFRQDQQSFVRSHINMFEFFGGVPEQILLDNLKAGVIKADLPRSAGFV